MSFTRIAPDVDGVAHYAIFVSPDPPIGSLSDLRDVPVAAGLMAESHFAVLGPRATV